MHTTNFKHDQPSRFDRALARKIERQSDWRRVCKAVDARDRRICRACGKHSDPDAMGLLTRGHRHHIVYRSAGGPSTLENLVTLCPACHAAEHQDRLRFTFDAQGYEQLDANLGLEFWRKSLESGGWYMVRRELAPHVVHRD
jgi:hypothetical protein